MTVQIMHGAIFLKKKQVKRCDDEFNKRLKGNVEVTVRYAHCGIAVEHEAFEWLCKQKEMDVNFEYTMPGTPQQNGQLERKVTTLFNWVYAMLMVGCFLLLLGMVYWLRQLILSCYSKIM